MRSWKALRYALGMMAGLFILVACSGDLSTEEPAPAATPTSVPLVLSSLERIASPDVPRADLRELAAGNNAFAFDLYGAISNGEDNLLSSPYSISQALAMTYAGARGETEQQMADTLHFTLPQERLHPAFNALDLELASRSHVSIDAASGEEMEEVAFELHIANAVWGQQGYPFLPEYLDVLAQSYGAGIYTIDFAQADAVDVVNGWVNKETRGRIPQILDSISADAKLLLANAIYFNAHWDLPFDEEETNEETFYLLDGNQVKVPMMHQTESFRYTDGDGYQAIELPYLDRKVAMVILLPQTGRLREIEDLLNSEWVDSILTELAEREVVLTLPKFSFETPIMPLETILPGMGMSDAFSDDADFAGMDGTGGLKIDRVLHKAFIEVNEQKTEAAAVTVVEMVEIAKEEGVTPPVPVVMKIDRPFIFFIRDIETDTVLFLGRVVDPEP
jgi:serpin B